MPVVSEIFAKRLRDLREGKSMTQDDLADACDVTKTSISRYERHETKRISRSIVERIARTLNVNTEWLLGQTDEMRGYDWSETGAVNDDETLLLDSYRKLNKDGKRIAKNQVAGLSRIPSLISDRGELLLAASGSEDLDEDGLEALKRDVTRAIALIERLEGVWEDD